jgi:hypothetical protein
MARRGPRALLALGLRELGDLPGSILRAHWNAQRRHQTSAAIDGHHGVEGEPLRPHRPATWAETLAGIAPFGFFGLWVVMNALPGPRPDGWLRLVWAGLLIAATWAP